MVDIEIDLKKSLGENISDYYSKIKKLKSKLNSAKEIVGLTKKQLVEELKKVNEIKEQDELKVKKKLHHEWYDKFRWFFTSSNRMILAGRDATTNEILIKKYTDENDIVFHADLPGSPFAVVKANNQELNLTKNEIEEIANFVVTYSRAWKNNISTLEVFYVPAASVTKQTKSGEYMKKGSFMIYGKKNYVLGKIDLAIGLKDDKLVCGPLSAISSYCKRYVILYPGKKKTSDVAKYISKYLKYKDIDEIIRMIPAGGCDIKKKKG